ncbi:hypothetical protein BJX99DRAFT_256821 [Aspergillus californicus]
MQNENLFDAQIMEKIQDRDKSLPLSSLSVPITDPPVFSVPTSSSIPDLEGLGLDDWIYLMNRKLEINADHYPTPEYALTYIISRTSHAPRNYLVGLIRKKAFYPPQLPTSKEVLIFLQRQFGN